MNRILRIFLFMIGLVSFFIVLSSCSEEIELYAEGPSESIVYCFLNPDDSIQYLRLSKSFRIPVSEPDYQPSGEEMVYDVEPEIYLIEEGTGFKQIFHKCSLYEEIQKDTGWFPVDGMQLYATNCLIKPSTQYSLSVFFDAENKIVFGETQTFGSELQIIDPSLILYREMDLFPRQDYFVRFTPVINAGIFQTTLSFIYDEIYEGKSTQKEFKYRLTPLLNESQDVEYLEQRVTGVLFFKELARQLSKTPEIVRRPVCFNFQISCGGIELYNYVKSQNNLSAFSNIIYTNLDNASGLFSSLKHQFINNVIISRFSIDSLAMSTYTKDLGFVPFKDL